MTDALICNHVTKTFDRTPAVTDLTFTLPRGDFLALLGPSGCGKTTSLRLIAGLESPNSGSIILNGKPVASDSVWIPAHQRKVGLVFQDYALFPHMNVARNISYGLNGSNQRQRVGEVLELVGLTGLEKRLPHELSGGQQQRVALARALAPNPSLILLDEPFSNLDAGLRLQVREEVRRIVKEADVSTILVTHDQEEAFSLADDVSVMLNGAIVQTATPLELYTQPATPEIARFIGDANLIDGIAHGDRVETTLGELALQKPATGPVKVLIRPEAVSIHLDDAPNAEVTAISYFGHDQLVTVFINGETIQVRTGADIRIERGQRVRVTVEGRVLGY
ncbi:MAG: ABC transporter ATP-binding protein [Chloroflexi bacterium]|nr:ABC transporter ATP-binding protein [Chloroflexota bacterium]